MGGVAWRFFFFFKESYMDEGTIRITSLKNTHTHTYIYIYMAPNIVLSAEETDIWSLPLSNLQFS